MRSTRMTTSIFALALAAGLAACGGGTDSADTSEDLSTDTSAMDAAASTAAPINPDIWPTVVTPPLDPEVEARVEELLSKMTLEQKVGQILQGDSGTVSPEDVKTYRLGSVLSGGNSAPGPLPYADAQTWLEAADAYYLASLDPEGVEVPIPVIWGIDAVHGHANLRGATVFPHNIGLGAANNPELIEDIMEVTARELSVSGHDWTFAPTLATPQNDRWGRTYEGFSEDPAIVKSYGGAIVEGLQGEWGADGFMGEGRVIPSAKHFVGDGGTENGVDQGDAKISQEELRDIHAQGYISALEAGAQTVMASFSAWQGQRMHGQKELLTDVLKGRMDFKGFVVGDWNGHGLIPGCTNTDCPQSFNAGVDMYMAPDSWKGLYESTLRHVNDGTISMERLDDANRRILRVKVQSGILDEVKPSERPLAGREELLGSPEHRAVARQAVRESLVLLKNNDATLPLGSGMTVLVTGDGADSISKVAGGWTLSWQGGGYPNSEFPNGSSVLDGIRETVEAKGGTVVFDAEGDFTAEQLESADAVIAVYGEDPYAEFQGDVENVDFVPNGFDVERLATFREAGAKVVSVFLSGRPLWTNPEMNDSDAFVAAWLPGSEGGGIADVLFQSEPSHDFTGRLSYSWPKLATQVKLNKQDADYDPLFPVGFGLSYADSVQTAALSEDSGLSEGGTSDKNLFFSKGTAYEPWKLTADGKIVNGLPFDADGVEITAYDKDAQEDSLRVKLDSADDAFAVASGYGFDFSRETVAAMELVFDAKSYGGDTTVQAGMGCDVESCTQATVPVALNSDWQEVRLTLSCFASRGVRMEQLDRALILTGADNADLGVANVRVEADTNAVEDCGLQ